MAKDRDAAIGAELAAIEEKLEHTGELLQFMLAFRLIEHGHATELGEAMRMTRDLDRVRALFQAGDDG